MSLRTGDEVGKPVFRTLSKFSIYEDKFIQLRAQVVSVNNGNPLLSLQKYHYDEDADRWTPTRKCLFLRKECWLALASRASEVSKMVEAKIPGVQRIETFPLN